MWREKKAILDCLELEAMAQRVTTDPSQAAVHVLPMHSLTMVVSGTISHAAVCSGLLHPSFVFSAGVMRDREKC